MGTQVTTFNQLHMDDAVGLITTVTGNINGGGPYPYNNPGIIVDSVLNCINGEFNLNQHLMTVNNPLPNAMVRTNGYVLSERNDNNNRVKWKIGTNTTIHTFPLGSPAGYLPFSFQLKNNTFGDVIVSSYATAPNNIPMPSTPTVVNNLFNQKQCLADNSPNTIDRFWQLDVSDPGGGGIAKLEFTYLPGELTGNLTAASVPNMRAQRYEAASARGLACGGIITAGVGVWATPANGYSIASLNNPNQTTGIAYLGNTYSVQVDSVTQFSPWTLSHGGTPLPIQLLNFKAKAIEDKVKVYWDAVNDAELIRYDVEKSIDKESFLYLGQRPVIGPGAIHSYELYDNNPVSGTQYYRLKLIGRDGNIDFSSLVPVSFGKGAFGINMVAPQNGNGIIVSFNYDSDQPYNYQIVDIMGRMIESGANKKAMIGTNEIRLPLNTPKGVYLISIFNNDKIDSKTFSY
ncbi:MAG: T9SS type A sorting domain-containing protein [Bacteroidetes bacterium]|nr:T9SS type A sorting domain-containing protein [Bacteroidota bacterium]